MFYRGYHIVSFLVMFLVMIGCRKPADIKSTGIKKEVELLDQTQIYPAERIKVVHLYKDSVYILSQPFTRQSGEQLIIDAGTLIKVNISGPGGGLLDAGIVINPGGIIVAQGTQDDPIVFTSNDYTGNQQLNWKGLTIQGHSTDNSSGPAGVPDDFSGTLSYCRIEFAPLVLTAVGSRTVLDHIQVSYVAGASSFEMDGGNFNARYLLSYACAGPADFYFTRGYTGKMQYLLAYRHPFFGKTADIPSGTVAGVVIENNPDSTTAVAAKPSTFPVISNVSVIGPNGQPGSSDVYGDTNLISTSLLTTRSTCFSIRNSLFLGFPAAGWYLNDEPTATYLHDSISEFSHCLLQTGYSDRTFYLSPGILTPFTSADFSRYMLSPRWSNSRYSQVAEIKLTDPFNYDQGPSAVPLDGSPARNGAAFDGQYFGDTFFERTDYIGALGDKDWTRGWSNYIPLQTNYNFPH